MYITEIDTVDYFPDFLGDNIRTTSPLRNNNIHVVSKKSNVNICFDSENVNGSLLIKGNIRSLAWNWLNGWSGNGWVAL